MVADLFVLTYLLGYQKNRPLLGAAVCYKQKLPLPERGRYDDNESEFLAGWLHIVIRYQSIL